jgi:hypothetical protein
MGTTHKEKQTKGHAQQNKKKNSKNSKTNMHVQQIKDGENEKRMHTMLMH